MVAAAFTDVAALSVHKFYSGRVTMSKEQVVVEFTREWRSNGACYRKGEMASFSAEMAKTLFESKFAKRVDQKVVQAARSKQQKADEENRPRHPKPNLPQ